MRGFLGTARDAINALAALWRRAAASAILVANPSRRDEMGLLDKLLGRGK